MQRNMEHVSTAALAMTLLAVISPFGAVLGLIYWLAI